MARMTSGSGALFQEGPVGGTGRIIELEHKSQVDSMRKQIADWKKGIPDSEGRAVLWQEIPQDQESFYMNPGGFSIRLADGTYLGAEGSSVNMAAIDQSDPNWVDPIYRTGGRAEGMNIYANTPEGRRVQRQSDIPNQEELTRLGMAQGWNRPMSSAEWLGFQGREGFINPSTGRQGAGGMIGQQQVVSTTGDGNLGSTFDSGPSRMAYDDLGQERGHMTASMAASKGWSWEPGPKNVITSADQPLKETGEAIWDAETNQMVDSGTFQPITYTQTLETPTDTGTKTDPSGVSTQDITGKTTVYFNDGTNELVDDSELTAFVAANAERGATTDRDLYEPANIMGAKGQYQNIKPEVMLAEIIKILISGSQSGVTPSDTEVIQMIMDRLGISQSDALDHFTNIVKPEWTSGIAATPVPTSTTLPVPVPQFAPPVATQNLDREELFAAQGAEDLQRRLLAGTFGTGLSPTGGRAARNIYSRFASQLPIMQFGEGAQLPGPAFASFLANQPDPAALTAGLEAIQAGGAGNVFFEEAFPDVESVVGAGMQPFLMGLNPRLRPRIGNILRERALTAAAQAPETVVTPEDRMAMLGNIMQFRPPTSGFQGSRPFSMPE